MGIDDKFDQFIQDHYARFEPAKPPIGPEELAVYVFHYTPASPHYGDSRQVVVLARTRMEAVGTYRAHIDEHYGGMFNTYGDLVDKVIEMQLSPGFLYDSLQLDSE